MFGIEAATAMFGGSIFRFPLQAMAHPDDSHHPSSANGEYDSAFPNVGLVVWQAGFVLGE